VSLRVLVVDDAAMMRIRLCELIEAQDGFEVVGEACDGKRAIEKYEELQPDLVTLDVSMPEMDGLRVLKELSERFDQPKVIVISAVGQTQIVLEAASFGIIEFIIKPYKPERVIQALDKARKKIAV
jgi:two-component system, chemotaxis family, chemotaxis protein CheY